MQHVTINLGAGGLGDALLSSCAVLGFARCHPGAIIHWRIAPHAIPFLKLFAAGYATLGPNANDGGYDLPCAADPAELQLNPFYLFECQTRCQVPRVLRYCHNLGDVQPTKPRLRNAARLLAACPAGHAGAIVLAPFSGGPSEHLQWPLSHWQALHRQLVERGYRVLTLDARNAHFPDRHERMPGAKLVDAIPEVVTGIVLCAKAVVANDSGLAHLAGILDVPTCVICGPTRGQDIFGCYGKHMSFLNGHLDCRGCYWTPPFDEARCNPVCPNLATTSPEEALGVVMAMAGPPQHAIAAGGQPVSITLDTV